MKELIKVAQELITKYVESGAIEKRLDENITKAFNDAVDDAFRWGGLSKSVKEVVEKKLVITVDDIDLQSYNAIMQEALKGQIAKFTNDQALEGFNKVLEETFGEAPKEISINEIVNKILDSWRSDDPCDCDSKTASIELTLDRSSPSIGDSYSLKINDGEKYSSNEFSLYFLGNKLRISHRSELNPTRMGSVEGWLFKLYAAKTEITGLEDLDSDDFDLELGFNRD